MGDSTGKKHVGEIAREKARAPHWKQNADIERYSHGKIRERCVAREKAQECGEVVEKAHYEKVQSHGNQAKAKRHHKI
jgi:hypothetical protein